MNNPFNYLYNNKGKEIRHNFTKKCFNFFKVPDKYNEIISLFEKMHCVSLIIDDIQDNSNKRRGNDSSHIIHGIPWTLASALSTYSEIITYVSNNFDQEIVKIIFNNLDYAFNSQLKEIYNRDKKDRINYKDYIDIVCGKTSALFKAIIETTYYLGTHKFSNLNELIYIITNCGILFQINDDYNNLISHNMHKKKGFADDLDEQKYSYIIVKYLEKNPNNEVFNKLFEKKKKSYQDKKKIISILSEEINLCKNHINKLNDKIKEKINNNNLNLLFDSFLETFNIIQKSERSSIYKSIINISLFINKKNCVVINILLFIFLITINKKIIPNIVIFIYAILALFINFVYFSKNILF
jgi:geranylgeranyl pyrophosphate synthase